jgi:hypothetical protein
LSVTVGIEPNSQKAWYLPKDLLARHSTWFASRIHIGAVQENATLSGIASSDFQNLVDYMHSSIYSPNTKVPGYRAIRANTDACLLGARLGARGYTEAAIRQLYHLLEPLARSRDSNAKKSILRASDIEYIYLHTMPPSPFSAEEGEAKTLAGLRQLFFSALASHWTQRDVITIGTPEIDFSPNDAPNDTTSWSHVYNTYHDFRAYVAASLRFADVWRTALLRPVGEYLGYVEEAESKEGDKDDVVDREGAKGERSARPRTKIPSLRRLNSERRRRRRERLEVEEMGRSIRDVNMGDGGGGIESEEEAVEEGDYEEMIVIEGIEKED